ncbi:MAG: coniferyl aldehyde dehydrogenase [Rhodobiaceae bacterium]|nr:coniferyl aldehyde dehydrogenase [Rhodobiaceae bacterium]MBT7279971.1 coniferyl aldehyde dehydrogenase [Rhodobiaceae bacterium]
MSAAEKMPELPETPEQEIRDLIDAQKKAHIAEGPMSAERRIDLIDRTIALLVENGDKMVDSLMADFGNRSPEGTLATDVGGTLGSLKYAKKNLRKWMKASKRHSMFPLGLLGASTRVEYQPIGCVGNVVPWNFPFNLCFSPMGSIFAAGNRTIIKPSEYTVHSALLTKELCEQYFDKTEVAVVLGGPETGATFSRMPFDHLLFTGATGIASHIMRGAAENLVPVTLELGGKSPVIVSQSADMKKAAARVMTGKTLNAGQICLAPDYVMVPEGKVDDFVEEAIQSVSTMFPTLKDNEDYTSVVNQRHYDRLQSYLDDAREKGAKIVEINPNNEDFSQQPHHKIPPTIVVNPTEDMKVMQEEIFGPILPVKSYKAVDDAIGYVNDHDRPLGLYYFGNDNAEENRVINSTTSGGVSVNDVITHIMQDDAPFGGVGPSGTGAYHGKEGFVNFSHAKTVFRQSPFEFAAGALRPPYGEKTRKMLAGIIKK